MKWFLRVEINPSIKSEKLCSPLIFVLFIVTAGKAKTKTSHALFFYRCVNTKQKKIYEKLLTKKKTS